MKFSIRDLLLVTVIVALIVGWLVDRSKLSARCRFSEEEIRQMVWAKDHMDQVKRELNKRGLEMVTVKGKVIIAPGPTQTWLGPPTPGNPPTTKKPKYEEWLPPSGSVRNGFQLDAF